MGKMGRPRHPDILTPREWEVLALIRERLTNEEIAQRLGISLDGAKYHVSQILSKLGVATREEAAATPVAEAFEPWRRRWWAAWPLWAKIAGAATLAAAAVGLAVLAWGVLRTGGPTDAQQQPLTTAPATVIPWVDNPAPNAAEPFTIPGVLACRADDLEWEVRVSQVSYIDAGPKDTSFWLIGVENKSTSPCFVGSTVHATLATAGEKLTMWGERTGGEIIYLEPRLLPDYLANITTPVPRFSRKAWGEIGTRPCAAPPITEMEISPGPGLGAVLVSPGPAGGWGTPCPDEPGSYLAHLSPEDCCSGSGVSTQTMIEAPASAHPGERLRFLITVINEPVATSLPAPMPDHEPEPQPSRLPLEWSPCPTYHQELQGVPGTFGTYRLNCEEVAPLAPDASAAFEMFIDVPPDAQPGPSVLTWGIDGDDGIYSDASINIWIEP